MADSSDEDVKMEWMRRWLTDASAQLGADPRVLLDEEDTLLDLIATIAHGPSRPGAPMTAFLVGYVAGATGRPVAEIASQVEGLAATWQ